MGGLRLWTENPRVAGSIPPLATIKSKLHQTKRVSLSNIAADVQYFRNGSGSPGFPAVDLLRRSRIITREALRSDRQLIVARRFGPQIVKGEALAQSRACAIFTGHRRHRHQAVPVRTKHRA